ncbi:MAG: ubiE/COQ5 methyltransferase [Benniella sp.]|nr:MAG: ubiE/COQ5 methyltransferase [Benniella sp.]
MTSQPKMYILEQGDGTHRTLDWLSWRSVSNSAAYLRPHIQPEMSILDVGCGPGSISVDMARLVPQGRVVGIDYNPEHLNDARAFATRQGVTNIEFQVGDINALDFPDNTFDIVHAHQVLQHVADPIQALREMRRVTKPGGIVAAREAGDASWYPELPGIKAYRDLVQTLGRLKGGNPNSGNKIHIWAKEAGFERSNIACSAGVWCFSTPEERVHWGESMVELLPVFGPKAVEMNLVNQDELTVMADAWKHWLKDEDGWLSILNGEIICRKE